MHPDGESGTELVANWGARPVFITSTFLQPERDWVWDFLFLAMDIAEITTTAIRLDADGR
jgi:hypothetical protein